MPAARLDDDDDDDDDDFKFCRVKLPAQLAFPEDNKDVRVTSILRRFQDTCWAQPMISSLVGNIIVAGVLTRSVIRFRTCGLRVRIKPYCHRSKLNDRASLVNYH